MHDRFRAYNVHGIVTQEGDVPPDGIINVEATETELAQIVFYTGALEDETVSGSIPCSHSGPFTIDAAMAG